MMLTGPGATKLTMTATSSASRTLTVTSAVANGIDVAPFLELQAKSRVEELRNWEKTEELEGKMKEYLEGKMKEDGSGNAGSDHGGIPGSEDGGPERRFRQ